MTTLTTAPGHAGVSFPLAPVPDLTAQHLANGTHEVTIYLDGATHIRDFVKPLGITIYKAGATGCRDAERRTEDLRRKKYASILKRPDHPDDHGVELHQGHEWFLVPLQTGWLDGIILPPGVDIRDGVIRLTVHATITVEGINRRLHALLAPRSFNAYLDSSEGQVRLLEAGYDPAARLHTRYTLMTQAPRLSLATELYLIRPRRELAAFVTALGEMVEALRRESNTGASVPLQIGKG
jgi:hypothetical protein